jgi:transposase
MTYSQDLRERVIAAVKNNVASQAKIAQLFGVSLPTIEGWLRRCRETGKVASLPHSGGPKRRLSSSQLESLRAFLLEGATAHGWENDHWSAKRVAEIIRRHFKIECSSHYAWAVLRQDLGWTSQRPIQRSKERDDTEIQRWRTQDFPRILEDARKKEAYLVFIDESGFLLAPIISRTFAPRGKTPIIKVADPHGGISVAGAITVSPIQKRLGFLYYLLPYNENFRSDSIAQFLDEIYHRISKPFMVLWDGMAIHSSTRVRNYRDQHTRIIFEEFPAHAPELNPVDKIWFYTKYDRLSNYAPATLNELSHRLIQEFVTLQSKPNVLAWCIKETGLKLVLG